MKYLTRKVENVSNLSSHVPKEKREALLPGQKGISRTHPLQRPVTETQVLLYRSRGSYSLEIQHKDWIIKKSLSLSLWFQRL